jgi:hypothetical protein
MPHSQFELRIEETGNASKSVKRRDPNISMISFLLSRFLEIISTLAMPADLIIRPVGARGHGISCEYGHKSFSDVSFIAY